MNRADHAEKQLRVMQQLDEDHTLTQLANAWVDLVMVRTHRIVPVATYDLERPLEEEITLEKVISTEFVISFRLSVQPPYFLRKLS